MPSRRLPSAEANAAELMQAVGVLLRRVRGEAGKEGLSWSQAAALGRLDRGGPMTTAELARAEMVKPQSMGTLLAELEQEGLVQRDPHPTDGRQILFSLTPAGVAARRQRQAAKLAWLTAAIEQFDPDEQRTLVEAIALVRRLGES
ncbi:MarR family winged helix-turn-helix transcriptional regulator [Scleromatobacter humisilvae]|uniref:MarR family transcriptional regulator n=1 Tax=Scleromatobacter humisilvae TaxID=2897159 RepID=A0A9X1YFB0_9BURK|nr:MarR family transcriptional regulator [Scleromatobacter humisilvae]MCK9684612.1 MarR family transcriptional regulator [Scleromatobacter humisilvae]